MNARDIQLDRHEAKYIIPHALLPRIRDFISPFCEPDSHGHGDPPEYDITTLQLDSPALSLYHAKEWDLVNRFKLRARTYGSGPGEPVFLEVKRKFGGCISKLRASIPRTEWSAEKITHPGKTRLAFRTRKEEFAYLEFVRLVQLIGAEPVVLIRYTREAYFGRMDQYARVSFDRALMYQPARSWDICGSGKKWFSIDCSLAQNKDYRFSGVVLELKTLGDAPQWMVDLVMHFGLERTGNCKYATAVALESLFRGGPPGPGFVYENLRF
jgi:SPX domain protein involved in polyphosphate accumulation